MTPAELHSIRHLPRFPETAAELIRVAGLVAAARIITAWPGQSFPVPSVEGGGCPAGERRWAQLAEVVGETAALAIVRHYRGSVLYVPSCKEAIWDKEKDAIRDEFDRLSAEGYSYTDAIFELGVKYNVTGRAIDMMLKHLNNPPAPPLQAQLF